jgi:hypothetical protein
MSATSFEGVFFLIFQKDFHKPSQLASLSSRKIWEIFALSIKKIDF